MQLRHVKTVLSAQDAPVKISAIAWSPNNNKLAVATADRTVYLFDDQGEKKDKFPTKPADASLGKKCYQVTALAFSPDSTKIAVGQSDNIIFVYRIGEAWGEKKAITAKVSLQSAVTCLIWPHTQPSFVFGQVDGKVRIAGAKGNKAQTLYTTDSYVVSLAASPSAQGIVSGHADGVVVRYFFEDDGSGLSQGPVCRHSCPPYALAWGSSLVVGGADQRVTMYSVDGKVLQHFDYSQEEDEKEFSCAISSPSGHTAVLGSYDRLRVYTWLPKRGLWEEAPPKTMPHLYTVTALSWRRDGSRIALGSLCGSVQLFEYCLKRVVYKNKFEMTYVGLSQVIVKELSTSKRVVLRSHYGYEIDRVQIMGRDRYLVARTSDTLLLGDLATFKLSEVAWHSSGGNEKFYFENESVCMIFNAGELCLVEYGVNDILGSVRTEFMNPHLISVRVNERRRRDSSDIKRVAYLVDLNTIAVVDLVSGVTMATFSHDSKVNWIELNETGHKLLFRDRKLRLFLVDVESQVKASLLSYCSYVQWVPLSDVVVAQNQGSLCIWYNIDNPDKVTTFPIKGDILALERQEGKTEVVVQAGVDTVSYTLDEGLVEFGTAVEDRDYLRALLFLETLEMTSETESMWRTLADLTLGARQLRMAQRCYTALGDVSKARYIQEVASLAEKLEAETGQPGLEHYLVQCRLSLLEKQFKTAESILLEQGQVEEAMRMYRQLHKWDQTLAVARAKLHPDLHSLEESYLKWLLDTGQEERAGELKEQNGELSSAVSLYMKAGLPAKAARILMSHEDMSSQQAVVESVASSLKQAGLFEMAGGLYEKVRQLQPALQAFKTGKEFRKAVELARSAFPGEVVSLEEEWGDHLMSQKQYDAAIKHFIEAGSMSKATDAAIKARQWTKAVQIVDMQEEGEVVAQHFHQLAEHFASVKNFEHAERYYLKAELPQDAEGMYFAAGQWETAYRLAVDCMAEEELQQRYCARGEELEKDGKLRDAERIYVCIGKHDKAISMYKTNQQLDHMVRLVGVHHPDLLEETHLHLAQDLEHKGQYAQAEQHFVGGGDWKGAINMYRAQGLWDDAYRVAKNHGGQGAANQVAYLWAKSLGGDSAVKLLSKFGLLEAAVDYATDNLSFDFAFDIARAALKSKLPEIHLKYAIYLEDEGKFHEAESEFLKADKPKEAVLMWVHQQDWDAAQATAEQHCPETVTDVFVGQARAAFERKDFHKAEGYLLRAERPDLAVKYYKEGGMWDDALRIVKEYMPNKLDEFQREMSSAYGTNSDDIISQARSWEQGAEYRRAVETYLKLSVQNCGDHALLVKVWLKAVDLACKFIEDRATDVVALVCDRLANIGEYEQAGELYLRVDMVKEALDMLMAGESWEKARHISKNVHPRYEEHVEEAYIKYLKTHNKTEEMQSVDPESALKMYADGGDWNRCLELAGKQGPKVLAKYVALYAAQLLTSGAALSALKLFRKFGTSANPQNFNIYRKLCVDILSMPLGEGAYGTCADLRDLLLSLVGGLAHSPEANSPAVQEFERLLLVAHYSATRAACMGVPQLKELVAKITVSMLRYTDILPADRAFYEAGSQAKEQSWESMSFVFFNRFLDLSEAIEEGSTDMLDSMDVAGTDIPLEVPLPATPFMNEDQREDVKEWVLALSMDQRVEQVLPADERGAFVASLVSPQSGITSLPCLVSGYPVLRNKVEFKRPGFAAIKDEWTRFMMAAKTAQECQDVLHFLAKWVGPPSNPAFSFK